MKTHILSVLLVLTIGVGVAVPILVFAEGNARDEVTIDKHSAEVGCIRLRGAKLSDGDQKELSDILRQFDNNLYKIETYDAGKVVKTQGKLIDALIGKATVKNVQEEMEKNKVSGWTLQLGECLELHSKAVGTDSEHLNCLKVSELIKQTEPILKKYSKP